MPLCRGLANYYLVALRGPTPSVFEAFTHTCMERAQGLTSTSLQRLTFLRKAAVSHTASRDVCRYRERRLVEKLRLAERKVDEVVDNVRILCYTAD